MSTHSGPGIPKFSRRQFIGGAVTLGAAGVLAACAAPAATPVPPTATPKPAATSAPVPTTAPAATSAPVPTATAKPAASTAAIEVVWTSWAVSGGALAREQERVDLFKSLYPSSPIKVNVRGVPNQGYQEQILTQLAGGVGPDVFRCGDVYAFAAQKQVADLEPKFKAKKDSWLERADLKKAFVDGQRVTGKLYSVPMGTDMDALFVNRTLFKQVGLDVPPLSYKEAKYEAGWTFDSILGYANKLTVRKGDAPPDSYGINTHAFPGHLQNFVESMGGKTFSEDFSKLLWTEEAGVKALQWIADLVLVHKVAPRSTENAGGAYNFENGKLGMAWTFVSQLNYRASDVKDKWDWDLAPWPHMTGKKASVSWWTSSWVLNANSKVADQGFEWLHFVSGPEGSLPGVELGWELPLFSELDKSYNKRIGEWKKNNLPAAEGFDFAASYPAYVQPRWNEAATNFIMPAWDEVLAGRKTVAQALNDVKPQVDKLLEDGAKKM